MVGDVTFALGSNLRNLNDGGRGLLACCTVARVRRAAQIADQPADELDGHERPEEQGSGEEAVRLTQEWPDQEDLPGVLDDALHAAVRPLARARDVAAAQEGVGRLEPELERLVERERDDDSLGEEQRIEHRLARLQCDGQCRRLQAARTSQLPQQRGPAVRDEQHAATEESEVVECRRLQVPPHEGLRLAR